MLLTAGWFWLALLFPLLAGISFWKRQAYTMPHSSYSQTYAESQEDITRANGNDVIDLYDVNFRPEGHNGIVKIFDEETEINPVNFRYFSDVTEDTQKRMRIKLQVETGNVEVVKG